MDVFSEIPFLLYGLLFHWVKNGQTVESDTYE